MVGKPMGMKSLAIDPTQLSNVNNTPYGQHESGLWVHRDPKKFLYTRDVVFTSGESAACRSLAETLKQNWLTRFFGNQPKPFDTADFRGSNAALVDGFESLGVKSEIVTEANQLKDGVQLVTFLHTFQKLTIEQAFETLLEIHGKLHPTGMIFIRMPDRETKGFERDLKDHVMEHNVTVYTLQGFLWLLEQLRDKFIVIDTYTFEPGQRDIVLLKADRRPSVCIGMIAKNEERDLPKCLGTLTGTVDGICLIDTGSKDRTMELAREWAEAEGIPHHVEQYTEASKQDESGDWKLWNFGKARNRYLDVIESMRLGHFDWTLWMDADDQVLSPKEISRLRYLDCCDTHAISMESGTLRWPHHRLLRTGRGIRYRGRCHEYPQWSGKELKHEELTIHHDAAPHGNETSNARNLRILELEFLEEPTTRCAFYLANTYKDSGKWEDAIRVYQRRIDMGHGYYEEWCFALLYLARCQRAAEKYDDARKTLHRAIQERPDWAEYYLEMGWVEYLARDFKKALGYALLAQDLPYVPTPLFREQNAWKDQPYRLASWAMEQLGWKQFSLEQAKIALEKIGGEDADWSARIARLSQQVAGESGPKKHKAVWFRNGAIGDILMTLNLVKPYKAKYPNRQIIYRCHESMKRLLEPLMLAAGVDEVVTEDPSQYSIKHFVVGYPLAEGYPEKPMARHLLEYFAKDLGIEVDPNRKDLIFESLELHKDSFPNKVPIPEYDYLTIHAQPGWSAYKGWGMDKWTHLVSRLKVQSAAPIEIVQIGGKDDPAIPGVDARISGINESLGAMAGARMHVGIDSWTNHATNIRWLRGPDSIRYIVSAVILWGSTQASAAGYEHNRNISLGLPCQPCFREDPKISQMPRGVCPNPGDQTYENPKHACMAGISVDQVYREVMAMWSRRGSIN